MPKSNIYLVPIDFSRGAERALDYALMLARENHVKVVALHVVPAQKVYPPIGKAIDFCTLLETDARKKLRSLAKRKRLEPKDCKFVLVRGMNFAEIIVRYAKKLRVTMIVMGSHGRTGLQRFLLGSVAERTLRYASCPVLIVK